jgi:small subunit ribosomal protein S1
MSEQRTDDTPHPRIDLDAKLEAEIEAALGEGSLEDMLDLADQAASAASGERERRTGTVVSIHGGDVFVEFGPKSQGVCPLSVFPSAPDVGQRHEFVIERFDADEGLLVLSLKGVMARAEWQTLEPGQHVEARCTGVNKGGLEMEVAKHRAFMPAGQVDIRHIANLEVFIGEKMPCEVLELDRKRGRIILSRRAHLAAERESLRGKLLEGLEIGKRMPAVITSLKPYGAFADLGGLDGLIHISDMSYQRINDPSEVVKEGDQVEVQILKIDAAHEPPRVSLGMKQCMADPVEAAMEEIQQGATLTGRITKLMPFGAFVELRPGVEGLIHISELSHDRVNRVSAVVKPDEVVTVKVLGVDPGSRRISLSIKALKGGPTDDDMARDDDPQMRKLKAQLSRKFGDNLKGGLG